MISLVLATSFLLPPTVTSVDPSLQHFAIPAPADDDRDPRAVRRAQPTRLWRLFGLANYVACGVNTLSVSYRQERSAWDPRIPTLPLNAATYGGLSWGVNEGSDYIRQDRLSVNGGWAARAASFTLCTLMAGYNFNRGFFRE